MRRSRVLGWDRNPLRRGIDRVEAAMVAGLIAVFLISAPVLATAAGRWIGCALALGLLLLSCRDVRWRETP